MFAFMGRKLSSRAITTSAVPFAEIYFKATTQSANNFFKVLDEAQKDVAKLSFFAQDAFLFDFCKKVAKVTSASSMSNMHPDEKEIAMRYKTLCKYYEYALQNYKEALEGSTLKGDFTDQGECDEVTKAGEDILAAINNVTVIVKDVEAAPKLQ